MARVHGTNKATAQVQPTPSFEVADAAELAAQEVKAREIGAVAWQTDNNSLHILVDTIPPVVGPPAVPRLGVWQQIAGPAQSLNVAGDLAGPVVVLNPAGAITVQLPSAPSLGQELVLVNKSANLITLAGGSTKSTNSGVAGNTKKHLVFDGTVWDDTVFTALT